MEGTIKDDEGSKAFLRDIGLASIAPFVTKLKGVAFIPIITKWVGATAFGVWKQFAFASGVIAILATMGLGRVNHRYLAPMKNPRTFSAHFFAIALTVAGAATTIAAVLTFAPRFFANRILGEESSLVIIYLLAAYLPVLAVLNRLGSFLKARRRFDAVAPLSIIRDVVSVAIVTSIIFWSEGVELAIAGFIVWEFAVALGMFELARHLVGLKVVQPDFSDLSKYLAFGLPLVLVTIGVKLAAIGDRFVIVNVMGTEAVGVYSVAYAGGVLGVLFLKPITQVLLADFSVLVERGKRQVIEQRVTSVLKYFISSQICIVVHAFFLGEAAIVFLSTDQFLEGLPVLKTVPFGIMALGILQIGTQILNTEENTLDVGLIWLGTGVLNFVANLVVIPWLGLFGAALVTVLSYVIGASLCWRIVQRRYSVWITGKTFLKIAVAAVVSGVALFCVKHYGDFDPFHQLLAGGILGISTYATTLLATGFVAKKEQRLIWKTLSLWLM